MKKFKLTGIFLMLAILFFGCSSKNSEQEIKQANDQFYAALNTMFTGEAGPILDIWSHENNITYLGPFGGYLKGWEAIGDEFKKNAAMKLGGKIVCKESHIHHGTDIGYVVCVEEGINISAEGKTITVSHRATNIFNLQNGKWKLIHHHTDLSPQLEDAFDKKIK